MDSPNFDVFTLLVDPTRQEVEEDFYDDGRSSDIPQPVSKDFDLISFERLNMGQTAGASANVRCNKCEKCVIPDCVHNPNKDIICVLCVFGHSCMELMMTAPCQDWTRAESLASKSVLQALMPQYSKPLKALGVDIKTIQGIEYAFKDDLGHLVRNESELDTEQLTAMKAVLTNFPTAQLNKISGFNNARSPVKENVQLNTQPNTVTQSDTDTLTSTLHWLSNSGITGGSQLPPIEEENIFDTIKKKIITMVQLFQFQVYR